MGDAFIPAQHRYLSELVNQRRRGCRDPVASERHQQDRLVALGYALQYGGIPAHEFSQRNTMDGGHFSGIGRQCQMGPPHTTTGLMVNPDLVL